MLDVPYKEKTQNLFIVFEELHSHERRHNKHGIKITHTQINGEVAWI